MLNLRIILVRVRIPPTYEPSRTPSRLDALPTIAAVRAATNPLAGSTVSSSARKMDASGAGISYRWIAPVPVW